MTGASDRVILFNFFEVPESADEQFVAGDGAMAVQLIHAYLASPEPSVSGGPPPAEQNILALAEQPDDE